MNQNIKNMSNIEGVLPPKSESHPYDELVENRFTGTNAVKDEGATV